MLVDDGRRVLSLWLSGKEPIYQHGRCGVSPRSGNTPGEGNSNPLLLSCLGNSMDREPGRLHPWGRKSQTQLSGWRTTRRVEVFFENGEWQEQQNMAKIASISITPLLSSIWGCTVEFLILIYGQEFSYMAYCDLRVISLEVNVISDNLVL